MTCEVLVKCTVINRHLNVWIVVVVQAGGAVCCLATSSSQLAAGLASGHAAVLDARSGTAVACWKGHDASVTSLAIIDSHQILTSSQVLSWCHLIRTCHAQLRNACRVS